MKNQYMSVVSISYFVTILIRAVYRGAVNLTILNIYTFLFLFFRWSNNKKLENTEIEPNGIFHCKPNDCYHERKQDKST